MDIGAIISAITLVSVVVGGYLLKVAQQGVEAGVTRSVETAIDNINWPQKLGQELEKVRGTERQELRYTAYAELWARQRPLAIYADEVVDQAAAGKLSVELSNWYFSPAGGLMLTRQVRDFYFALQDLLRSVAEAPAWQAERPAGNHRETFVAVLKREQLHDALATLDYLKGFDQPGVGLVDWPRSAPDIADKWKTDIAKLATGWDTLSAVEGFVVLQQVGSVLRTSMVNDVESRLR
jgi:hypothetical protein